MNKLEMYQQTIENTKHFGEENGLLRLKVETAHFEFVFERADDNSFELVSTKAVIRVLGKVTKVKLTGSDTYEAAYERVRQHWSDYFKSYRQGATPTEASRAKARVRARRHYSNKRAEERDFLERG
ncbi:MAG: hypothetical protein KDK44_06555 [Chlamydiia bacterium]|nr:hypothetical protein [Chlamydiia bacterium]